MKKTILFVLLLLFSCMSDDDPVSPPEQPKDTVDTVKTDTNEVDTAKVDTNEVDTPITTPPKDTVGIKPISKEMADTIMLVELFKGEYWGYDKDTIFHRLDADTVKDIMGQTKKDTYDLRRTENLMLANDTLIIELGTWDKQQDTTIILKNDSWIYFSRNDYVDCVNQKIMILDAVTLEVKKFGNGCNYYTLKDEENINKENIIALLWGENELSH